MQVPGSQTLGNLTVDWLTRWFRQQQQLYPTKFLETFAANELEVVQKLVIADQVEFSAYGTWRYIGSQGQPAFANSWANYGAPYDNAAFMLSPDGLVRLHGVIKSGTVGSAAFTLPPAYRPNSLQSLGTLSNGVFGRVDVDTSGNVTPTAPSSNASVVLDGLWFKAK